MTCVHVTLHCHARFTCRATILRRPSQNQKTAVWVLAKQPVSHRASLHGRLFWQLRRRGHAAATCGDGSDALAGRALPFSPPWDRHPRHRLHQPASMQAYVDSWRCAGLESTYAGVGPPGVNRCSCSYTCTPFPTCWLVRCNELVPGR